MTDIINFNSKEGNVLSNYIMLDENLEYIGGMFPKGKLSALIGNGMAGKSWTLIKASLSITSGIPFLPTGNYTPVNNQGVLLLETEGRLNTYVKRIKLLGGDINNYVVPSDFSHVCRFNNNADKRQIENVIDIDRPKLLILDSFGGFSNVDENSYQVMDCMKWLVDLAVKYDIAVVFTQYINKTDSVGKLTYKSMRGFSGLSQMPEVIWAIESINEDQKRLYQIKTNIDKLDKNEYICEVSGSSFDLLYVDRNITRNDIYEENKGLSNKELLIKLMENEPLVAKSTMNKWLIRKRD